MAKFVVLMAFMCLLATFVTNKKAEKAEKRLLLLTVATEANDGFLRFAKSAEKHGLELRVLGMGKKWQGGDMNFPGGGQKVMFLKEVMESVKDDKDLVVMFTDSYDVVLSEGPDEILRRFKKLDANVVFGAEGFCWPDPLVADRYPQVRMTEKRFLNSGGIIGYAPYIHKVVNMNEIQPSDDDQLYYTNVFLDETVRSNLSLKLDVKSEIFQNLNGAVSEVELKFKGNESYLYNQVTGTVPAVIHGNGPSGLQLNSLGNYLNSHWTQTTGCQVCDEDTIPVSEMNPDDLPSVYLAIFLNHPMPFVEDFFQKISALNYPKSKITLFIHNYDSYHDEDVTNFMDRDGLKYDKAELHQSAEELAPEVARNQALEGCVETNCKYYFHVEGDAQLENPDTLLDLIHRNKSAIAPLLIRPEKLWSNFWGALSSEGFYKRSDDYMDIIKYERLGLWNVPYITSTFLVHGYHIPKLLKGFIGENMDMDMAFCRRMRDLGIFMFVDNMRYYGHLVDSDNFTPGHKHDDLYELFDNKYTWEQKYLHPDYHLYLSPDKEHEEPCPDVFWQPLVSPTFCQHLIEECEHYGKWSGGKDNNADPRLAGGYENVPTVDIHMNQIGWEKQWLRILADYIAPIASKVYTGYYSESRAIMNFVVRYKPTEQDRLRPHSDSSTFTSNLALNRPHLDYTGGGVRFLRYNCTVVDLRQGWFLIHPGRLTHHHEGLQTTGGTRYIMISFIDP